MTELDKLMAELDSMSPEWATHHASQRDLADFARERDRDRAMQTLRKRVAQDNLVFIQAALCAGIVDLPTATVTEAKP